MPSTKSLLKLVTRTSLVSDKRIVDTKRAILKNPYKHQEIRKPI